MTRLNIVLASDLRRRMAEHCHQAYLATGRRLTLRALIEAALREHLEQVATEAREG